VTPHGELDRSARGHHAVQNPVGPGHLTGRDAREHRAATRPPHVAAALRVLACESSASTATGNIGTSRTVCYWSTYHRLRGPARRTDGRSGLGRRGDEQVARHCLLVRVNEPAVSARRSLREAARRAGLVAGPAPGERFRLTWHEVWRLVDADGVELTSGLVPRYPGHPPAAMQSAIDAAFGPYLSGEPPARQEVRRCVMPGATFRLRVVHDDGWWVAVLDDEPGVAVQVRHTLDVIPEARPALARLFGMRADDVVCTLTLRLPDDVQTAFDECWAAHARFEAARADFVGRYDRAHRLMDERFRSVEARQYLPPRHLG